VSLLDRLCKQPDESHWERFVMLFTPILMRWANRLGVPAADTQDLLQEVYTTLFKQLPEFRYDSSKSFRAWLWTIFHRQTIAWRRRQLRDLPLTEKHLESLASPDSIAEATEEEYRRVLFDRVLQVVQTDFPEQTWRIFWEVAVANRPGKEVAKQFGVTPNTVYLARARVLARLRQELADLDK
jgi:RNA polymerase sigma-70 factor (ECF subfamily)